MNKKSLPHNIEGGGHGDTITELEETKKYIQSTEIYRNLYNTILFKNLIGRREPLDKE